MTTYHISCHCQAHILKYTVPEGEEPGFKGNGVCDCSHCFKRRTVWVFAPKGSLEVVKGVDGLQEYRFGSKKSGHQVSHVSLDPATGGADADEPASSARLAGLMCSGASLTRMRIPCSMYVRHLPNHFYFVTTSLPSHLHRPKVRADGRRPERSEHLVSRSGKHPLKLYVTRHTHFLGSNCRGPG